VTGGLSREELEGLKERGWRQVAAIDAALERGEIADDDWHRAMAELVVPAYLAGDNPRAQSGHSGDAVRWEGARRLLLDAVERPGSFLDIGCANGHLMECLHAWAAEDGTDLEPWGLEISVELAELARRRLPHWRDRISVGNALDWKPPSRFTYARANLDYVPTARRAQLLHHLLGDVVAPDGRLIIGVFNEELHGALEETVSSWGFEISGRADRPHPDTSALVRRAFWMDAAAQ
jgi:trans-aconitate methyltransferase